MCINTKGSGYNEENGSNSSWGGSVLFDNKTTTYHMYLAEFEYHCGVNSLERNSIVTHAISTNGYNSPYKRIETIHSHFAHEPTAIYGANNEIVLYYAAFNYSVE